MGLLSSLVKIGLVAGASITAYQASEKSKQETGGKADANAFVRNFKNQAVDNTRFVVDTVRTKVGGSKDYRYSDEGENGYTYVDAEPADKVSEVFETMKEKAPEVIGKVQDFVEDVREHAPEYKERAKDFAEDVKEAAKKAMDNNKDE